TSARLVACAPSALRPASASGAEVLALHVAMVDRVLEEAHEYDVIHWHIDHLQLPLCARSNVASVTTLHGRLDVPNLWPSFRRFAQLSYVSLSNAQRAPLPFLHWVATVPHGMPA